jgi:hypothetical protein
MEDEELFELRGKHTDFDNVDLMARFLRGIFSKGRYFPMVVGDSAFIPENGWRVEMLKPIDKPTLITVENYFEALKALKDAELRPHRGKLGSAYCASCSFNGVDSTHYDHWDSTILSAKAFEKRNQDNGLYLRLCFSGIETRSGRVTGYTASSEIPPTRIQKIGARFVGPNTSA